MPQPEPKLWQLFTISVLQTILLSAAVFSGFVLAGLRMNPFAAKAHITLFPHFCFVAAALLLSAFSYHIATAAELASYGVLVALPTNWILSLFLLDQESPLPIALLGIFAILGSLSVGWVFGRFRRNTTAAKTWISTTALSSTIVIFTLMPNPN